MANPKMDERNEQFMWDANDRQANTNSVAFPAGKKEHGGNIWQIDPIKLNKETHAELNDAGNYLLASDWQLKLLFSSPAVVRIWEKLITTYSYPDLPNPQEARELFSGSSDGGGLDY
jgi:hypothetical protein